MAKVPKICGRNLSKQGIVAVAATIDMSTGKPTDYTTIKAVPAKSLAARQAVRARPTKALLAQLRSPTL